MPKKAYLGLRNFIGGATPRGAALFRQDGQECERRISKRLRNANTAFSRPCRHQLRFACRDLKEIIDDRERQPPNLIKSDLKAHPASVISS